MYKVIRQNLICKQSLGLNMKKISWNIQAISALKIICFINGHNFVCYCELKKIIKYRYIVTSKH